MHKSCDAWQRTVVVEGGKESKKIRKKRMFSVSLSVIGEEGVSRNRVWRVTQFMDATLQYVIHQNS